MYTVIDLGTNANLISSASGINNLGQVVGASDLQAFLWTPQQPNGAVGTFQPLGTLLPTPAESTAFAINDIGQVVGVSDALDLNGNAVKRAFLWNPTTPNGTTGVMQDLGTLNLSGIPGFYLGDSEARAINSMGQVVGSAEVSPGISHAFLWAPNQPNSPLGLMFDLHTLLPQQTQGQSVANSIDDQGRVVGTSDALDANGNTVTRAFLWTPATPNGTTGVMQDLGTLMIDPATGQFEGNSFALDINNQGFVVGASDAVAGTPPVQRAFFGSLPDPVQDLSTPFPGSLLRAINNLPPGQGLIAVGDMQTAAVTPPRIGFFYSGNTVVSYVTLPLQGWLMEEPTDINDNGQVCGTGSNAGMGIGSLSRALLINP